MKWNKEENYISSNNENVYIHYWCDWVQWIPNEKIKWNWKNVTLIALRFEDDIMTGGREIEIGLLGFNLRIRWTHETTEGNEFKKEASNAMDNILNKSFYGWADGEDIDDYRNKETSDLPVVRTRKRARELGYRKIKKLFIQ